jgi:hypothetical protein
MAKRMRWATTAAGTVVVASVLAAGGLQAGAQRPGAASAAHDTYKVPRTPWGDPDLQGNYTNLTEAGTPLERPKEYAGRLLTDVSGEELAKAKRDQAERTIARFKGPLEAPDNWWQPAYGKLASEGSQAWMIVDPPDGTIPALTADAQKRQAARDAARRANTRGPADSWTDRSLYDRCITRGLPGSMMPAIYGNAYQFIQAPGYVAIVYEMIHETRVIPIGGGGHVSPALHLDMGDARGRWDGDTLVVETTNFLDRSVYMNANPDRLRLIERFTRISPRTVRWSVTVDDPTTWVKPWTFAMPLTLDETEPLMPYECHEGNYGLKNILSAARATEREAAGGAK